MPDLYGDTAPQEAHPHPSMDTLVAHVQRHALDHYNQGGWDYIVECYSDAELAETIGPRVRTLDGAIAKVARETGIHVRAEVRRDIQGA
jgi:hypothetical protein